MSKIIFEERSAHFEDLVGALADERRYIAAHALLTMMTGHFIEQSGGGIDPVTGKTLPGTEEALGKFNGLRVDLLANGSVVIPDNQRALIASKWRT